jgi:hypothetical protein
VHFVNFRDVVRSVLTLCTVWVRNVNRNLGNASTLTLCTLTAAGFAACPTQRS